MDKLQQIALTLVPGMGATSCRRLVEAYPEENPFEMPPSELRNAFAQHPQVAEAIANHSTFARAEQELLFAERHGIRVLFFTDAEYPQRLNHTDTTDCPALLYVLGSADLNPQRAVAIVGTRRATGHGRDNTTKLVSQLQPLGTPIISGLAYGIDTAAHTAALDNNLPTVAVLGHGLDRIYPPQNRHLAERIVAQGGAIATEYLSQTAINPRYFPARNRIIAAMADATVVVEASESGGALITAAIANSYQREVFAMPGRVGDTYSRGTNNLIATNKATMLRSADDICYHMGWPLQPSTQTAAAQTTMFATLQPHEQAVVDLLHQHSLLTIDEIAHHSGMPLTKVASIVFGLELQQAIRALPGRLYEAVD